MRSRFKYILVCALCNGLPFQTWSNSPATTPESVFGGRKTPYVFCDYWFTCWESWCLPEDNLFGFILNNLSVTLNSHLQSPSDTAWILAGTKNMLSLISFKNICSIHIAMWGFTLTLCGKTQNCAKPVLNSWLTTHPQSWLCNASLGQFSHAYLGMHGRFWYRNDPTVSTSLYSSYGKVKLGWPIGKVWCWKKRSQHHSLTSGIDCPDAFPNYVGGRAIPCS